VGGGDEKEGSGSGGGGGGAAAAVEAPTDEATIAALYKQAATKFNIKQKDCIKFLIEKVGAGARLRRAGVLDRFKERPEATASAGTSQTKGDAPASAPSPMFLLF
jgi:hypothetical protein